MFFLERALSAFALAQTIIATLRSGSRALYILKSGSIGVMDGPLILSPAANTTDSPLLWEVSTAFRYGVELALDGDRNTVHVDPLHVLGSKAALTTKDNSLSYLVDEDTDTDDSLLDEAIDAKINELLLLLDSDEHELLDPQDLTTLGTRIRGSISWSYSLLELSIAKAFSYTASLPRSLRNRATNIFQKPQEDAIVTAFDHADDNNNDDDNEDLLSFSDIVTDYIILPAVSNSSASSQPKIARISALAPQCFADLRGHFGITEESFRRSMLLSGPFVSFQSNSKGAARTGGVFFFTRDGAYMIKTIKRGEVQTLLRMLPKYYRFMKQHGRRSLLTRFCGIYQVTLGDGEFGADGINDDDTQTIVVMNSVFPAEAAKFLSERFDLKGSTVGRKCSDKERQSRGSAAVLKDLDLIRESELVSSVQTTNGLGRSRNHGNVIQIGTSDKTALLSQLRKDVGLLVDCGVIDYSLLVGVVHMQSNDLDFNQLYPPGGVQPPRKQNRVDRLIAVISAPVRVLLAPSFFVSRKAWSLLESSLSWPLPYYGSGDCVVDGGKLAQVRGEKRGQQAIFYFGLIDFLQPFDFKKAVEYKWKGFLYKEGSYSCVPPDQYADRFLKFIDDHLS